MLQAALGYGARTTGGGDMARPTIVNPEHDVAEVRNRAARPAKLASPSLPGRSVSGAIAPTLLCYAFTYLHDCG